jgi:hypothetical protein
MKRLIKFLDDYIAGPVIVVSIVIGVALGIFSGGKWLLEEKCENKSMGYEHQIVFPGGCQVKLDGRWVDLDNVRVEP